MQRKRKQILLVSILGVVVIGVMGYNMHNISNQHASSLLALENVNALS